MSRSYWVWIGVAVAISAWLGSGLLLLIALFAIFLGLFVRIWSRYCLTAVAFRRSLSTKRLFPGELLEMTVEVTNSKPLPLPWLRIDDQISDSLRIENVSPPESRHRGKFRLSSLLALRWYERVSQRFTFTASRRGLHELGPVNLRSSDPFGFVVRRRDEDQRDQVLVYPHIFSLEELGLPMRFPLGDLSGRPPASDDPLQIQGAREYVRGDSIRRIHWKATAKRGRLLTKVHPPSTDLPVVLAVDLQSFEEGAHSLPTDVFELIISVAASLARQIWTKGYPLGLVSNGHRSGHRPRVFSRPSRRPEQLLTLLESLASLTAVGSMTATELLTVAGDRLRTGTTLVVLSGGGGPNSSRVLADLGRRGFGIRLATIEEDRFSDGVCDPRYRIHIPGARWRELTGEKRAEL